MSNTNSRTVKSRMMILFVSLRSRLQCRTAWSRPRPGRGRLHRCILAATAILGLPFLFNGVGGIYAADNDAEPITSPLETMPKGDAVLEYYRINNGDAGAGLSEAAYKDPVWSVRAGAAIMKRERPASATILSDAVTGRELLNAADYTFDLEAAVDLSVIRRIDSCNAIEFRFFGSDAWTDSRSVFVTEDTVLNTDPPGIFSGCDISRSTYDSELFSQELNWRRRLSKKDPCCGGQGWWTDLTVLAGLRYLELNEDLRFLCSNVGSPPDIAYNIETDNRLYGLQIGADGIIWSRGRCSLAGIVKAGVYYNAAQHRSTIENPIGTVAPGITPIEDDADDVAFVGEAGLTAVYQLTKHTAFRAGYQVLWVGGVAVASEQVEESNFATGRGIDTHGDVFYHGALIGLEVSW